MALENVMRVDNGNIVSGGGAGGSSVEIDWEDWCELTPEEQEIGDWTIINCPWADGNVSVDLMTKLWENPDPTAEFAAQDVTLANSDYDFLVVVFNINSIVINKGGSGNSLYTGIKSNIVYNWRRYFTNPDDTTVHFYVGNQYQPSNNSSSNNNTELIPIAIYGIKLTATVKINAIAMDVSTSADKCMLSDGVTSVEDKLEETTLYKDITNLPSNGEITSLISTELDNGYIPAYACAIYTQQFVYTSGTTVISSLNGNRFFALFLTISGSSPTITAIDSSTVIRVFFTKIS